LFSLAMCHWYLTVTWVLTTILGVERGRYS
jgi:hypothetical protein